MIKVKLQSGRYAIMWRDDIKSAIEKEGYIEIETKNINYRSSESLDSLLEKINDAY